MGPESQAVEVVAGDVALPGDLEVPPNARGIVVFAHGSGSSRSSPRNRAVASVLHRASLATLLFDLLTRSEERDRGNVFDIALLGGRLGDAVSWLTRRDGVRGLPVGLFGASTGAAAAVMAAAEPGSPVRALVSRGGRPDLADTFLPAVRAPTLLIVGELDEQVLAWNRAAATRMRCEHRVDLIPGATHLFEEPGTLQAAAEAAREWFARHLGAVNG